MRILGLDIGSSSVKAGIWDTSRRKALSRVRVAYPTRFDGARVEISAARLLHAVRKAGRDALSKSTRVDAVAFCAFSSGVVVTDERGSPRTPIITHADRRSVEIAQTLVTRAGKAGDKWWLSRAGNLPYPGGIGASTLAWLTAHEPDIFRTRYRAGQVSCLVGRYLTGRWVIDPSQAAFLGLWNYRKNQWDAELCSAVDVDGAALPELHWADEVMGGLLPGIARAWSIPELTPVIGGLVDTGAAVLQTPMSAGQFVHNAGSTDVLALCLNRPRPAAGILTRPVGVGRVFGPQWLAVRTIAASGSALQWVRDAFFREVSKGQWNRKVARACRHHDADSGVVCLPAFAGERAAIGQSAGAEFRGLHLGTTREEMLAAVVHGLVTLSAGNFDLLRKLHDPRSTVYAMGGAGALGDAMHRGWHRSTRLRFVPLSGDALPGLAHLAQKTLGP